MAKPSTHVALLDGLAVLLRQISVANGYNTDAGMDVRTEPNSADGITAPRITVYAAQKQVHPQGANRRAVTFVVEAVVPVVMAGAQRQALLVAEDIESALQDNMGVEGSLPFDFEDEVMLEKPEGLPVMCVQQMWSTGYVREVQP